MYVSTYIHFDVAQGAPRISTAGATRDRLLDAALFLFSEMGYRGTTTRAIAERAGVSEVTLFRTFGSKEGLFLAVIDRETDIIYALKEFKMEPGEDLAEDLTRAGEHIIKNMRLRSRIVKIIMMEASRNPKVWQHVSHAPFEVLSKISEFFQRAKDEGKTRDIDPDKVALSYFSFFFRSLVATAFLGRDVFSEMDEEALRAHAEIIVSGISTGKVK